MTEVVRPTLARALGGAWLVAGAALVVAGVLGTAQGRAVGWELPFGLVAAAVGWWGWQCRLAVDDLGIEQQVGWRRARLLWGVVGAVEVDPGLVGPVRVRVVGREDPLDLLVSWGTTRTERDRLRTALARAADRFGVEVADD